MIGQLSYLYQEFFFAKDVSFTYADGGPGDFEAIVNGKLVLSHKNGDAYPSDGCMPISAAEVKFYDAIAATGIKKRKGMSRDLLVEKKWIAKKPPARDLQKMLMAVMRKRMQHQARIQLNQAKSPARKSATSKSTSRRRKSKSPAKKTSSTTETKRRGTRQRSSVLVSTGSRVVGRR